MFVANFLKVLGIPSSPFRFFFLPGIPLNVWIFSKMLIILKLGLIFKVSQIDIYIHIHINISHFIKSVFFLDLRSKLKNTITYFTSVITLFITLCNVNFLQFFEEYIIVKFRFHSLKNYRRVHNPKPCGSCVWFLHVLQVLFWIRCVYYIYSDVCLISIVVWIQI